MITKINSINFKGTIKSEITRKHGWDKNGSKVIDNFERNAEPDENRRMLRGLINLTQNDVSLHPEGLRILDAENYVEHYVKLGTDALTSVTVSEGLPVGSSANTLGLETLTTKTHFVGVNEHLLDGLGTEALKNLRKLRHLIPKT